MFVCRLTWRRWRSSFPTTWRRGSSSPRSWSRRTCRGRCPRTARPPASSRKRWRQTCRPRSSTTSPLFTSAWGTSKMPRLDLFNRCYQLMLGYLHPPNFIRSCKYSLWHDNKKELRIVELIIIVCCDDFQWHKGVKILFSVWKFVLNLESNRFSYRNSTRHHWNVLVQKPSMMRRTTAPSPWPRRTIWRGFTRPHTSMTKLRGCTRLSWETIQIMSTVSDFCDLLPFIPSALKFWITVGIQYSFILLVCLFILFFNNACNYPFWNHLCYIEYVKNVQNKRIHIQPHKLYLTIDLRIRRSKVKVTVTWSIKSLSA